MKKLINDPNRVTREMLEGVVAINPALAMLNDDTVVVRSDLAQWRKKGYVAIISGGGAGHEPAHAGYVGEGMLTAAVSGEVFTSPSTDAVLSAIRACATSAGVLLIIKNYTGDRLNFGLAAELARAEGIPTDVVIVADDAAFEQKDGEVNNRRGIAGTVLVHKVAGAAAAAGLTLEEVKVEASRAAYAVRTMGVGLSACTVPAVGSPGFELAENEIEFGLGIHGERGVRRGSLVPADEIAAQLVNRLIEDSASAAGSSVVLLVNNLGATPLMELAIVARAALHELRARNVRVERVWCGTFLSAIDMAGCSISIMPVDALRLTRLDAGTAAPGWTKAPEMPANPEPARIRSQAASVDALSSAQTDGAKDPMLRGKLQQVATALLAAETKLTALDQAVGDGDLGISMSRAAHAIQDNLDTLSAQPVATALMSLSNIMRRVIAGSSGPFYAVGLGRAAARLKAGDGSLLAWAAAFDGACDAISELGGANPGDRTMLDALYPAAAAFRKAAERGAPWIEAVDEAVSAAEQGARETAHLLPRRGRSVYIGERALGSPDPGAEAVAVWLAAITGRSS
jgi:triose/dihydroxyacetone kinase / FAD-AMP lyase (cyclizing)